MKIDEIIELSIVFSAEVNVERDFRYATNSDNKIDGYLPNRSSRKIIKTIFETLSYRAESRLHLITASYGTGKSYLLLILAYLLDNKNADLFLELSRKLIDKDSFYDDGLSATLQQFWEAELKYLIVIPQYGTEDFEQGMLAALSRALVKNDISYVPHTNYIRAAETLQSWQTNNRIAFEQFQELLPNKNCEDFIRLLRECDAPSYIKFKELYKKQLYSDFSENHGDIYAAFKDTARYISSFGFKGIVTIYDEFGGVLEKLINKSELSSTTKIQDFLEYVKDKKESGANLIFIAASHQDPSTLNENKQQNIDKLLGRFEIHRLQVEDDESEELIAEVFRKRNEANKDVTLNSSAIKPILEEVRSMDLYLNRTDEWVISKIIKSLYPLHPLTAYILPRLSNQFAQNNRTMFNFLSPKETSTGSLRTFVEQTDAIEAGTGKVALFTPDLLLDYFRPNLVGSSAVSPFVDAFDDAMGKENDPAIRRLFRNILILTTARRNEVRPYFEVLLNAMRFKDRHEFKSLLDDLVANDKLEQNPISKVYEFPIIGTRNFGKVFEDEKRKLSGYSIYDCKTIWETIQPLDDYKFILHQEEFGANRAYANIAVFSGKDLEDPLNTLRKIYNGEYKEPSFQGYLVFLLLRDERQLEPFQVLINGSANDISKYIVLAKAKDTDIFQKLIQASIEYQAYYNTSNNAEIKGNANHSEKARSFLSKAKSDLSNIVKQTFLPKQWYWSFDGLNSWQDIDNLRVLDTSMNAYISRIFTDTICIKDDALWFGKSSSVNTKAKTQAITNILTAEKKSVMLYNGNNNAQDNRIMINFFASRMIAKDTRAGQNIQFGEIIVPKPNTAWHKAWSLIDDTLIVNEIITPEKFITPLLQSPFGLSESIIKLIIACYARYNVDILIFYDFKSSVSRPDLKSSLIDEILKKPGSYGIRKIEMSDFAKRYVKALHGLFSTEGSINSFENVSRRFEFPIFFTALQQALVKKDAEVKKFYYSYLIPFNESLKADKANRENEAKEFFMETLPPFIIPETSKELFLNDNDNIKKVVAKLKYYKEYPYNEEDSFKLEVLRNIAAQVFGKQATTPDDFRRVVKEWFEQLSPNTKSVAQFENEKIRLWLRLLRSDNSGDVMKFYLDELPIKPIKDWSDLFNDQSIFINTIRIYKEEIDNYKKSPIEVYQFIARACFEISKTDCSTEALFIILFQQWWDNIPQLNKEAEYEHEFVNIFIREFSSGNTIAQRLLTNIPIKWKDAGLLSIFTNDWENWTNDEVIIVSNRYGEIVPIINNWEAPIPEKDFVMSLAEVFDLTSLDNFSALKNTLLLEWYEKLPHNTRSAQWQKDSIEANFLETLNTNDLRTFFMNRLPAKYGFSDFKYWKKPILKEFLGKVKDLRNVIENYRRPLIDVINELDRKLRTKSNTIGEFRGNLKELLTPTDAFNNNAENEDGYLTDVAASVLLKGIRNLPTDVMLTGLIEKLAVEFEINEPYHLWLPDTQTNFTKKFSSAVKYLKNWKFPEEQLLLKAKEKISAEVRLLQTEFQLSDIQLFKVLRDLINEATITKS